MSANLNPPNPQQLTPGELKIDEYTSEYRDALLEIAEQVRKAKHHDVIQVIDVEQARNAIYRPQKTETMRESVKIFAPLVLGIVIPVFWAEITKTEMSGGVLLLTTVTALASFGATVWAVVR